MSMEIIKTEKILCACCMEEHEVKTVRVPEHMTFKGVRSDYVAEYYYCDNADEYYADEEQMSNNDIRMKNGYRKAVGLLTTDEICQIRTKYGISQSDLCALLGCGAKTIARYENHQVQDRAHDTMLRKLDSDPEWFLELLFNAKDKLPFDSYLKYLVAGKKVYEDTHDSYLRKAIEGYYANVSGNKANSGNAELSLDKVVDVVAFFANEQFVKALYKVKLMKLMWYADALSYKRTGRAITGLVYTKKPMGALPIAHDLLIDLKGIAYEEVALEEGIGYHFTKNNNTTYTSLTEEEIEILRTVARKLGGMSTKEIIDYMHKERAYTETAPEDIIQFKYAEDLSID